MNRTLLSLAAAAAVFALAPCGAATLVSVTGGNTVNTANTAESNYAFATSWTFGVDHTGVAVSGFFGGVGQGRAYLMKDIGTGITVASQIATIDFTPTSFSGATVNLFQNVDLVAGTYFLVIQGLDAFGVDWRIGTTTSTAENVTLNSGEYALGVATYAPASDFVTGTNQWTYTVTGTAAVPEPASASLALAGAALLLVRRRR